MGSPKWRPFSQTIICSLSRKCSSTLPSRIYCLNSLIKAIWFFIAAFNYYFRVRCFYFYTFASRRPHKKTLHMKRSGERGGQESVEFVDPFSLKKIKLQWLWFIIDTWTWTQNFYVRTWNTRNKHGSSRFHKNGGAHMGRASMAAVWAMWLHGLMI